MNKIECPICNYKCDEGKRYCTECGSVERHRALINLYNKNIIGDLSNKNVLIVSEGKRDNGKYYETSYFFSKISILTTLDIMDHTTYFKDTQRYDVYESLENLKSIKDNSFDCVICNHVLTAVEYDLTSLTEISRVLKKNGIYVMNDGISYTKTESFIANKGQYIRRYYNINDIKHILSNYFGNVELINEYDNIYKFDCEYLICRDNKKTIKNGVSVPLPNKGWWRHVIFVFCLSRTGSSSLEIALQNIGYNTIFCDSGRCIQNNNLDEYDKILLNYKKKNPLLKNIDSKFNAFILGSLSSNNITKIISDYPGAKIICTDRNDDDWIISMKNHQLVANRPNPRRVELINTKKQFIKNIKKQIYKNKFTDNFLLFNADSCDKYNKLCKFLHKNIPNKKYPRISTNRKLILTQEQINF